MDKLEIRTREILKELKIPASILGHAYILDAVRMVHDEPVYMFAITKRMYPEIAKRHKTADYKVERAIRHAVNTMLNQSKFVDLEKDFILKENGNIANSSFIAAIVEKIRIEESKESEV